MISVLFGAVFSSNVSADGLVVSPSQYYTYETQQKALIIYQDGREELVISISFKGNSSDFGWIVPLPSKPEVSKVDNSIFRKLQEFTKPKENLLDKLREDDYYDTPMMGIPESNIMLDEKTSVEVIEQKSIGIYDYTILTSQAADDLRKWMDENDYSLPSLSSNEEMYFPIQEDSEQEELWSEALPTIQDYIDDDWYFVTVKVNNKFTESTGVENKLAEGAVDPLKFSFETTDIIYPMKLTALSKQNMAVDLYVINDRKVEVENYDQTNYYVEEVSSYFTTNYAGKITKTEIEDITKEIGRGSWFTPKKNMRITKLSAYSLPFSEMDEEIILVNSDDNNGVNDGSMTFVEWLVLPVVLVVSLPYLLLNGVFHIFGGGYYYHSYELEPLVSIMIFGIFILSSIIALILTTKFLPKVRRKFLRVLLYCIQFPSLWLVSSIISLGVAIPVALLAELLTNNEGVVFMDSVCCLLMLSTLLPVLFYRKFWKKRGVV